MKYTCYDELPGYLKRYSERFGWSREQLAEWVNMRIPLLDNQSILEALSDGKQENVNNVFLRVGDSLSVKGYFE